MDAAIEKLLSKDIDIDKDEEVDFEEGSSGSEDVEDDEIESDEEQDGSDGGEEDEPDSAGEESDDQSDMDADLDDGGGGPMDAGTSSEDSEGEDVPGEPAAVDNNQQKKGFLEGGKDETFNRAFARIVDASTGLEGGPILAGSKSIARRRAEDEEQAKVDRAAKKLRQEMKQRGHVVPGRRGTDPDADAKEKGLQKTATRGVVRLFNAVAKAQKRLRETQDATGSKAKAARLGKASFLAELRHTRVAGGEGVVPSAREGPEVGRVAKPAGVDSEGEEEENVGWDVLQQGFTGLQGGSKMKDWDKEQISDEDPAEGAAAGGGIDDGSDEDEDGW